MERLKSTSDAYSPWRDIDPASEKILPRNSDIASEDPDCRSYALQIVKETITEVELKVTGLMGIEVTYTVPRSSFYTHTL